MASASEYTFTSIDAPDALGTQAFGINDSGDIVGIYSDATGTHAFLYKGGSFTTIVVPGASYINAYGINNSGDIVGSYGGATGDHGFIATAVPKPVSIGFSKKQKRDNRTETSPYHFTRSQESSLGYPYPKPVWTMVKKQILAGILTSGFRKGQPSCG